MKRTRGVSLLELTTVTVVFAVILALALGAIGTSASASSLQSGRIATNRMAETVRQRIMSELAETRASLTWVTRVQPASGVVGGYPTGWPVNFPADWPGVNPGGNPTASGLYQGVDFIMYPKASNYNVLGGSLYIDPVFDQLWVIAPSDNGEIRLLWALNIDPAGHPYRISQITQTAITLQSAIGAQSYVLNRAGGVSIYRAPRIPTTTSFGLGATSTSVTGLKVNGGQVTAAPPAKASLQVAQNLDIMGAFTGPGPYFQAIDPNGTLVGQAMGTPPNNQPDPTEVAFTIQLCQEVRAEGQNGPSYVSSRFTSVLKPENDSAAAGPAPSILPPPPPPPPVAGVPRPEHGLSGVLMPPGAY
jgi:hypothetical protein